jgi:hypothetical protein
MRSRTDTDDVHQLVHACASEDAGARRAFQERYGQDIYNFPVKITACLQSARSTSTLRLQRPGSSPACGR